MKTVLLNCNSCGAPLKVEEDTRYVHCSHCDSQLEVVHEEGAAFTRIAERLAEEAEDLRRDAKRMRMQNRIRRLDERWRRRSERLRMRTRTGRRMTPNPMAGKFIVAMGVFGACAFLVFNPQIEGDLNAGHLAIGSAVAGWVIGGWIWLRGDAYEDAEARYRERRRRLRDQLRRMSAED